MTAQLVGSFVQGSPEWHAARAGGLGGSEIAAVLGLSPFESRFSLYYRKRGEIDPVEETPEMEWGRRLESVILDKFADEHPDMGLVSQPGTYRHTDRAWQVANPDALAHGETDMRWSSIVEAKFSLFGDDFGEQGTDEIPVYYRTQAMHYLDVFGLDVCHFAVLVGGHDYREYVLRYDADEAAVLRQAAVQFLDDIAQDRRPDIDEHGATYSAIKELHPDIDGSDIDLTEATALEFLASREAKKTAEQRCQLATSMVADEMGEARRAFWDGDVLARRQAKGDGLPYVVAARNLTKEKAA